MCVHWWFFKIRLHNIIVPVYKKILILKESKDLSGKKLWNKFLVAIANGITTYSSSVGNPYIGITYFMSM